MLKDATTVGGGDLRRWLAPDASLATVDPLVLADVVTDKVRRVGLHHVETGLLADLDAVRARHGGRDALLDAFLDCVLAKHDGRYWNRPYLCIPVLEHLVEGSLAPFHPIELSAVLVADIVRHELYASARGAPVSPLDRPDAHTLHKRVRHAGRYISATLGAAAATDLVAHMAHEPRSSLPDILEHLPVAPARWAAEWLEVTVQRVSTVHDEYFFIRALQAHEMMYAAAAVRIAEATAALRDRRPNMAASLINQVTELITRGVSLFRMVATMRHEAFHTFRDFTDGASAIQSEQYKRFEARCGRPPQTRFDSPAFDSVPKVKAEVGDGDDSLVQAWLDADRRAPGNAALAHVAASMAALETSHHRWKTTHLGVATRMLGSARGTGYTAGVPYLQSWVEHRLFWQAPPIAAFEGVAAGQ